MESEWRYGSWSWGPSDVVPLFLWWLLAHLVGMLHYRVRFINLNQHELLKKRHRRLLASIRDETEHCEQLLKNILPPHVLGLLNGLVVHADHQTKSGGKSGPAKTIAERCQGCSPHPHPHPHPHPSSSLQPQPQPLSFTLILTLTLTLTIALALALTRYQGCSFLFAKIGGLSSLVNDDNVEPREMMHVLQVMFDRFDALADMFGVQKVRKTANEYYLVAAGLPNPKILPSPEERACGIAGFGFAMINIMNIINLELKQYGITFSCQVGASPYLTSP